MKKILIYITTLIICLIILIINGNLTTGQVPHLDSVLISIIATIFLILLGEIAENIEHIKLWFQSQIIYRNKKVRFTISYLFRITNGKDRYFLVYSEGTGNGKYQPVGGRYKVYGKLEDILKVEIFPDSLINSTDKNKDDLKGEIKGKNILKIINWFQSRKSREVSQHREFYEEIVKTEIFKKEYFNISNLKYKYIKTNPIKTAPNFHNKPELKILEIYELLPDEKQKKILDESYSQKYIDKKFLWADINEIKNKQKVIEDDTLKTIAEQAKEIT